jgi:hypothetical protein
VSARVSVTLTLSRAAAAALERDVLAGLGGDPASLARAAEAATPGVRAAVRASLLSSPEFLSLVAGKLRTDLGLPDAPTLALAVVEAAVAAVSVVPAPPDSLGSLGGLSVVGLGDDAAALAAPQASYANAGKAGGVVPWLEWLLRMGVTLVVARYWVRDDQDKKASRTGRALMLPVGGKRPDGFRVDPAFAGTQGDNWLTRAAEAAAPGVRLALRAALGGSQ